MNFTKMKKNIFNKYKTSLKYYVLRNTFSKKND